MQVVASSNLAIPTILLPVLIAPGRPRGFLLMALILVTNDDGVHAPGIRALADALKPLGQVHVVAPDREVSACSQSLTLKQPLRVEQIEPGSTRSTARPPTA